MMTRASPGFEFPLVKARKCCRWNKTESISYKENHKFSKDWISELPDEILVSILSRLTVKEAARTSILSHRWENMWKLITVLDFGDPKANDLNDLKKKREVCSRWVNHVLKSHQAPTIEEFRICSDLINISEIDTDYWIRFALQKRVQKLELDLSHCQRCSQHFDDRYSLKKQPFGLVGFTRLSTLCMKEVRANQEIFDYLLASSPLLEKLSIKRCHKIVNLKITSPSLNLKYLTISRCGGLESIEISALHLVSFKFVGNKKVSLLLKNAPQLAKVSFHTFFHNRFRHMADMLSRYLPQLKELDLDLSWEVATELGSETQELPKQLPELSNLRHLKLTVTVACSISLPSPVMLLLDACPLLHRFTLELTWEYDYIFRTEPTNRRKHPLPYLKVVELLGFVGDENDQEVAMYLIENAVSLEKLVISHDLSHFRNSSRYSASNFPVQRRLTRECAMKLGAKLPSRAEFILLEAT